MLGDDIHGDVKGAQNAGMQGILVKTGKFRPIDEIKIDRSFVSELNNEVSDQVMVASILNMANHFDLTVVAEGIETTDQLDFLRSKKCDIYQGFYFSKPLKDDDFRAFCENRN